MVTGICFGYCSGNYDDADLLEDQLLLLLLRRLLFLERLPFSFLLLLLGGDLLLLLEYEGDRLVDLRLICWTSFLEEIIFGGDLLRLRLLRLPALLSFLLPLGGDLFLLLDDEGDRLVDLRLICWSTFLEEIILGGDLLRLLPLLALLSFLLPLGGDLETDRLEDLR